MQAISRPPRHFVSETLEISDWNSVSSYFDNLLHRELTSSQDLEQWLRDRSELDSVLGEDYRWRYVRQSCDTENKSIQEHYQAFVTQISPSWMQVGNQLDKKLSSSPLLETLDKKRFGVFIRSLKNQLEIFRDENIPLFTELNIKANEYGSISGAMTIEHNGETLTLQQAGKLLQSNDRELRKDVYEKINQRRLQDREKLDLLFNELLKLRHQVALNAGFDNFRDYMMRSMGRFDYTVADCEAFHEAIASEVIPLAQKIHAHRKKALGLDTLKPYDLEVETSGKHALTPFNGGDELVAKSLKSLGAVDAYFSDCIETMKVMGHLDLDSRIGKAPGGYNMPLPEIGVPFIFMNAAGIHRDVHVMVHEAGHAVHSFLTKDLAYDFDKNFGSEVAELASMSMELLTMEHWDSFYENEEDLQRAKTEQIESIITILPWIAIVDKFQHWIYTHPEHTVEERTAAWMDIHKKFASKEVDWSEYEAARSSLWQRQLHIFEVPFYYIEYGIAQLGALGVWRNSKENKTKAIADYKAALSLGNLVTIPEVYKTAGVPFDFSKENIASLMQMLAKELGI